MSSRTALRWGAVAALCPAPSLIAAGTTFPTIAGPRVYDSRIDLIANAQSPEDLEAALTALENKPLLVVYTEEHSKHPYGADNGVKYPARENVVVLVVEALIGAKGILEVGLMPDGTPIEVGTLSSPISDAANEAILDWLDDEVCRSLATDGRDAAGEAFRMLAWEHREYHSTPQRAADRTFRLASRTLKFHIKIKNTNWPTVTPQGSANALPQPLAAVLALLPPDSYAQSIAAKLASLGRGNTAVPAPAATQQIVIFANVDGTSPTSISAQAQGGYVPPASAPAR